MIGRLTLSQFRSHRRLDLSLDGRPVAIHGPNGAGKTSILEAVSLLSPGRGFRRARPEELGRREAALGWKVVATLAPSGHQVATFAAPGGGPREVTIDDKPVAQVRLARVLRQAWLVPSMDRLWIEAPEGRRRFLDRLTLSLFPAHADNVLAYERAMRERNRLLKEMARDPAWYAALEVQMAEAGAAMTAARTAALARVALAQDAAATAFPAARLALVESGPADLAAALAGGRSRDMAAGRTLEGPHRADLEAVFAAKAIPASQASTGEQKALLISLVLANARAIAEDVGEPPVLLLDEVAAHLDAGRRAALYDEICALGAQAFVTGTEAGLFDSLGSRAQHLEVSETGGESLVRPYPDPDEAR